MERYPDLKKEESIELEGFRFTLDDIQQGFMRWFIVEGPKTNDQAKKEESDSEKRTFFRQKPFFFVKIMV